MATHSEVAHRWAQDDPAARSVSAQRVWFERNDHAPLRQAVIFSHGTHWPLAAFIDSPHGRAVLVNEEGYSVSTRQHLGHVAGALRGSYYHTPGEARRDHHGYPIFGVRYVDPARTPGGGIDVMHRLNREWLLEHAAEAYGKAGRCRSARNKDWEMGRAARYLAEAQGYSAAFDLPALPDDLATIQAQIAAEASERAAAIEAERVERARREAERLAQQRVENAEAFAAWQADAPGSYVPAGYYVDEFGGAYCRRHKAEEGDTLLRPVAEVGDILQTSQGASVPWRDALRVFKMVCRLRAAREQWAGSIRVGHYTLTSVGEGGDIRVGCHLIRWPEIDRLATAEGVTCD